MVNTRSSEQESTSQDEQVLDVNDAQEYGKEYSDLGGEPVSEALSEVESPHKNDSSKTHYPIFLLTKPTEEYWNEFRITLHARHVPWFALGYKPPWTKDSVLTSIERDIDHEDPVPFIGRTIDQAYDYHKEQTRPTEDSTIIEPFTYFTFLVVDDDCITSDPPHCIVCCDAPDYDDPHGDVTLKQLRVPIETAVQILIPLEVLTITPSESLRPDGTALCSVPPYIVKRVPKEDEEVYTAATPAQARMHKQRAMVHKGLDMSESALDLERQAVLFPCAMEEAIKVAEFHRVAVTMATEAGGYVTFGTKE